MIRIRLGLFLSAALLAVVTGGPAVGAEPQQAHDQGCIDAIPPCVGLGLTAGTYGPGIFVIEPRANPTRARISVSMIGSRELDKSKPLLLRLTGSHEPCSDIHGPADRVLSASFDFDGDGNLFSVAIVDLARAFADLNSLRLQVKTESSADIFACVPALLVPSNDPAHSDLASGYYTVVGPNNGDAMGNLAAGDFNQDGDVEFVMGRLMSNRRYTLVGSEARCADALDAEDVVFARRFRSNDDGARAMLLPFIEQDNLYRLRSIRLVRGAEIDGVSVACSRARLLDSPALSRTKT